MRQSQNVVPVQPAMRLHTCQMQVSKKVRKVVIIGGGWAGLAAAYHLLDRQDAPEVVIIDEKAPGEGGASGL